MFCTNCGKSLEPDTRFCGGCGKPIAEDTTAASLNTFVAAPVDLPAAPPAIPTVAVPVMRPAAAQTYIPPAAPLQGISAAQPGKRHMPGGVIFISVLSIIAGLISIAGGLLFIVGGYSIGLVTTNPLVHLAGLFIPLIGQTKDAWMHDATTEGFVALLLGIGYLFVAVNLWQLKEVNGRILGMVFSGIVALHSAYLIHVGEGSVTWHVIAIGFNAWIIYYLAKPAVKRAFAPPQPSI